MRIIILSTLLLLAACGGDAQDPDGKRSEPAAVGVTDGKTGESWANRVDRTPEGGYRMGNPDAPVKLVEYGSRTCPACGEFGRTAVPELEHRYVASGRVSYEFRDFAVHGIPDVAAALVGQCAGPERFFPILNATYADQKRSLASLSSLTPADQKEIGKGSISDALRKLAERGGYVAIAERAGLPAAKAPSCFDAKAAQAIVDRTNGAKDVESTPTFIVNGRKIDGHAWPAVERALQQAGA